MNLKNPENVSTLHHVIADVFNISNKNQNRVYSGIMAAPEDRKPNLIFDVTLKGMSKLASIARDVETLDTKKKTYISYGL
ncbi:hypothetical protein ALHIDCOG_00079 [Klebsiella phage CPRSB]|nr:hypothetical protein ALHIDCOG_00079 [Klebsiella phage CPRSB]